MSGKIESLYIQGGYAVTAGVGSSPIWIQELSGWLQLGALAFAVMVGATTFYLNVLKIREKRGRFEDE